MIPIQYFLSHDGNQCLSFLCLSYRQKGTILCVASDVNIIRSTFSNNFGMPVEFAYAKGVVEESFVTKNVVGYSPTVSRIEP
jgi:hypothetical protein